MVQDFVCGFRRCEATDFNLDFYLDVESASRMGGFDTVTLYLKTHPQCEDAVIAHL